MGDKTDFLAQHDSFGWRIPYHKWQQSDGIDKKLDEMEAKFGFLLKKRYWDLVGPNNNTLVIERIWESMVKMEEVMEKANSDPDYLVLGAQLIDFVSSQKMEVHMVF